jgi:F0F1-type ATP synthase delta subunit
MFVIFMIFFGQLVFAVAVIFVLKRILDKELMKAALEKFESSKLSPDIKEITVFSASSLNEEFKGRFESIRKRRFVQTQLIFKENSELKGGVVIAIGELLLDFSIRSRLQNFWS